MRLVSLSAWAMRLAIELALQQRGCLRVERPNGALIDIQLPNSATTLAWHHCGE
jgi:hypothetical protein